MATPSPTPVKTQALALPAAERAELAHELLLSLESNDDSDAAALWDREIEERLRRLDAGESETMPADEVMARLDQKLNAFRVSSRS